MSLRDISFNTEFIISKVRGVTNNAFLINFIENGIRKINGILRVNVVKSDKCDFGFKNQEGSYFYINIGEDNVYVYSDNLNYREEVIYNKTCTGIKVNFYGNYRIYGERGLIVLKKIEEESFYDYNKKFILSNTHIEHNTCLNGIIMKKLMGTNYDQDIKQCVVGNEIVKIDEIKYHYIPEVNSRKCYVSEYINGFLGSVNEKDFQLPLYSQVNGDFSDYEFKIRSIEKNNAQKQKTMI